LSTEVGVISSGELCAFVVTVLLSGYGIVALAVEFLVTDELLELSKDVLVSLEDGGVYLEHVNLVFDLGEAWLTTITARLEVDLKVGAEPVDKGNGFFVAHEVVDEELVFGAALFLEVSELVGVAVDAALDEVNVLVGGGELVVEEFGVILGVIVYLESAALNIGENLDGCFAFCGFCHVTGVGLTLLVDNAGSKAIKHICDGIEDTFSSACALNLAAKRSE